MKYQHQSNNQRHYTQSQAPVHPATKRTIRQRKAAVKRVRGVATDYFKNKMRAAFVAQYYAEKNWINRNVLKKIIMLPTNIEFAFGKLKCRLGFHFYRKQQLVDAGIRPPKQRKKYYHQCFLCGKVIR
jgi:hypothetical protein